MECISVDGLFELSLLIDRDSYMDGLCIQLIKGLLVRGLQIRIGRRTCLVGFAVIKQHLQDVTTLS